MGRRTAKADVVPVRQQNQYNCVTTSLCMALRALGVPEAECSPARVNKVVGAMPLQGAAWEPMLAAANHYGMRATLTLPSTVRQLKAWTDAGKPVVIAWNPEGREWSHASLVFDVDDDLNVYVADPNIPDPDETVRVVPKGEFYQKWYEKAPQGFLIRRPACVIEREITPDGRQVMASSKRASLGPVSLGEMMVSAASQARLFHNLDVKRFVGAYEEVGQNLVRLGHTSDPEDREFLVREIDKGLKFLRSHNIKAMSEALDQMTHAYDHVETSLGRRSLLAASRVASRYAKVSFGDGALWSGRRKPTPAEVDATLNSSWQDWTRHSLPDDLYRYFKRAPGAIEVPLGENLIAIRAREKGIANANRFMWLAYWGEMDRRKPISLRDNGDGTYTILDGNSTFANAYLSGWRSILGKVVE